MRARSLLVTALATGAALLGVGCDGGTELAGPTRGTWLLKAGTEGRFVSVTDTAVRLEVDAGALGSATLRFRGTEYRRAEDHVRGTFEEMRWVNSQGEEVLTRILLTRDSSVVWQGDQRSLFTSRDSVLQGRARFVLVPSSDSSLTVAFPAGLPQEPWGEDISVLSEIPWPESGTALQGLETWRQIHYEAYQ